MKIIVFGGAGYLGTELVAHLELYGHEVILYDNLKQISNLSPINYKLVRFINDDVANIDRYPEIFNDIDRIYYLNSPRLSELKEEFQVYHELDLLKKVLTHVQKNNIRFYFTSSCSVYGVSKNIVNEDSQTAITSLYSKLKIKSERMIRKTLKNYTILRLSTLFGHGLNIREDVFINDMVYRAKRGEHITIYDPEAKRPHLHVIDAADILASLVEWDTPEILNIGFNENNFSKLDIIKMIDSTNKLEFTYEAKNTNDSRNYTVDFTNLHSIITYGQRDFLEAIEELIDLNHIFCSVEEWDTIIDYYRPNGSSKTWYLEEENKMVRPKMWGDWNIGEFSGTRHKDINFAFTCAPTAPDLVFTPRYSLKDKKHLYLINIYDSYFFQSNKKLGFSVINKEILNDVRQNKAAIVILHLLEGYSGNVEDRNPDLTIIDQWIRREKLPPSNVHYIHGNLLIKDIAKRRGHNVICHPINYFISDFMGYNYPRDKIVDFLPVDNQYLALSYNRQIRAHRIKFVAQLYKKGLLDKCKISLGYYDADQIHEENEKAVAKLTPITIDVDKNMDKNWVDDLSIGDYEKTFISVISETLTYNDVIFFSEKTWKTIYAGHPFLLIGNPYSLRHLKSMGFKTFSKWVDESYDNEINMEKRIEMVANELKKFEHMKIHELEKIRHEMSEVCAYNKMVLIKIVQRDFSYNNTLERYRDHLSLTKILRPIYDELNKKEVVKYYEENLL